MSDAVVTYAAVTDDGIRPTDDAATDDVVFTDDSVTYSSAASTYAAAVTDITATDVKNDLPQEKIVEIRFLINAIKKR